MGYAGFDANRAFRDFVVRDQIRYVDFTKKDNQPRVETDRKWFDFLVEPASGRNCIIEVKGRTLLKGRITPSSGWVKAEDVHSMLAWQKDAYQRHQAVFAFAFGCFCDPVDYAPTIAAYGMNVVILGIAVEDYKECMTKRSERWNTVTLPKDAFYRLIRPILDFF